MTPRPTSRPYGKALAEKVANHLMQHGSICLNQHRDYCGVAFFYQENQFVYDYVQDGLSVAGSPGAPFPIRSFAKRAEFVAWLAQQSDESLSGQETGDSFTINNQRITRQRLEEELTLSGR